MKPPPLGVGTRGEPKGPWKAKKGPSKKQERTQRSHGVDQLAHECIVESVASEYVAYIRDTSLEVFTMCIGIHCLQQLFVTGDFTLCCFLTHAIF